MPTYVVLVNLTDQGIRNVKQTTERTDHGGEIAEKHGLKLEQAYWTVGPYDMVAVFEAPDDEVMSAHLLEISSSMGTIRTTTLRAYTSKRCRASSKGSAEPSNFREHLPSRTLVHNAGFDKKGSKSPPNSSLLTTIGR